MFKYTLIFLCTSAFILQAYTNAEPLSGGSDEVKKAFEELMKVIDQGLTAATDALNKAMDEVNDEATKIEDKAKTEVDKVVAPLKEKLDNLVQQAADLGLDVTKCQTYVDQFAAIPDNTVDGVVGCITSQVAKAKSYCDDALANCKQVEQDLAHFDSDIDGCSGNVLKKAKCYAKILKEILDVTKTAPQHIVEDVAKATALITNLFPIIEQCEIDQVKGVGTSATKLVADWAVCAGLPF